MTYPDGSLLKSSTLPAVWLVQVGQRHWIPSPDIFNADGFSWQSILTVSDSEVAAIPQGPDVPLYTTWITPGANDRDIPSQKGLLTLPYGQQTYKLYVDGGFYAYGRAKFVTQTGMVTGELIATCSVVFFGFIATTAVLVLDSDNHVIWKTPEVTAGVSAKGFGPTQVNIKPWTSAVPADVADRAAGLALFLGKHDPSLGELLDNSVGKLITELTPLVAAGAAYVSGGNKSGGSGTKSGGTGGTGSLIRGKPSTQMTTSHSELHGGWGGTPSL